MASATAVETSSIGLPAVASAMLSRFRSYASVMPCGLSSSRPPSSVRTSSVEAVEMSDLLSTAREL